MLDDRVGIPCRDSWWLEGWDTRYHRFGSWAVIRGATGYRRASVNFDVSIYDLLDVFLDWLDVITGLIDGFSGRLTVTSTRWLRWTWRTWTCNRRRRSLAALRQPSWVSTERVAWRPRPASSSTWCRPTGARTTAASSLTTTSCRRPTCRGSPWCAADAATLTINWKRPSWTTPPVSSSTTTRTTASRRWHCATNTVTNSTH